eukprot:SAG31_NODE_152_length_22216_cov_16.550029_12_plen_163_part_00
MHQFHRQATPKLDSNGHVQSWGCVHAIAFSLTLPSFNILLSLLAQHSSYIDNEMQLLSHRKLESKAEAHTRAISRRNAAMQQRKAETAKLELHSSRLRRQQQRMLRSRFESQQQAARRQQAKLLAEVNASRRQLQDETIRGLGAAYGRSALPVIKMAVTARF